MSAFLSLQREAKRSTSSSPARHSLSVVRPAGSRGAALESPSLATAGLPWNFSRVPVFPAAAASENEPERRVRINRPGDQFEREAEQIADRVMRMERRHAAVSAVAATDGSLQRKCACGGTCSECRSEERDSQHATAHVHGVLSRPGDALDAETRALMQSRIGADFSRVRVHADSTANDSARAVDALAYTVGQHIVFGQSQYQPATPGGQRLLAHELVHVMQQKHSSGNGGGVVLQRQPVGTPHLIIGPVCVLYEPGEEAKSHTAGGILATDVARASTFQAMFPTELFVGLAADTLIIADFGVNETELHSSTKTALTAAAAGMAKGEYWEIVGYSDCIGAEDQSSLRLKRAIAVSRAFGRSDVTVGPAPNTEFLAAGNSPEGRALNRAVIIRRAGIKPDRQDEPTLIPNAKPGNNDQLQVPRPPSGPIFL